MRLALAVVGLAAFTNRVGAEGDSRLEGTDVIDNSKQQSTQVLHNYEEGAPPWWQRAWAAGSQLMKRSPKPQDGQDAPIVSGTGAVTEEQCSGVQVVTSTITPVTTATVTATKETTTTQFIYPSQGTTADANDETTVIITPSDYGVDLPPVTTMVTRYPSDHSWGHSWAAGSWNSEWERDTATYTVTISEIEMPVTSTIYSGVESVTATGTSAEPDPDTTELNPAGPETVTKTVTISNVEIPWTTTKPTSQEVVTSIFTTTIDGSNGGVLETTTIVQGNGPQTTVAIQPGETAESMDRPSYVYTTVTYTSRLSPPFQNPNDTSAMAATSSTSSPTMNETQPPNFSLTTVTSTFQVPASTAIETQYTTTSVSGNDTQSVVVTEGPSNSQSSLLSSSPASEPNFTSTFTNTANGRPNGRSSSQVSSTLSTVCLEYYPDIDTNFKDAVRKIIVSSAGYEFDDPVRHAAHFDFWIVIIFYAPRRTANNTPVDFDAERPHNGIFDNAVNHETWSHICCDFEWTECYVARFSRRAVVKHSVFNRSAFIRSAAVNDYERLHDLERFLGPSAFEVVRLIKPSSKPASHISIKLFSTSGVVYSAVSIVELFGIAAFLQLLGLVSNTIPSLAVLSKLDPGVPAALEFAKYVNYSGFDFHEHSTLRTNKLDYCGAPAFIWLGIFYDDALELPELLRSPTYEIVQWINSGFYPSSSFHLLNDVRASSFDFVGLIECAITYTVVIIRIECPTSSILKLFACSASDFVDLSAKPDLQLTEFSKCDGRSAPNYVDVPGRPAIQLSKLIDCCPSNFLDFPGRPVLQLSKCNGRSSPDLLDFSGRAALRVVKLFACISYYLFDISSRSALQLGERIGRSAHNLLDFPGRPALRVVKLFACNASNFLDLSGKPDLQFSKLVDCATSYFSDLIRATAFQLVEHFDCTAFNFIGRFRTAAFTFGKLIDCSAFKLLGFSRTAVFDIFHLFIRITSDFWNLVKLVDPLFFHVLDVIQLVDCTAFNLLILIELVRHIGSNCVNLHDFDAKSYVDFAGWSVVYNANSDKFNVQPHIERAILHSVRFDEFGS
ncbi:hypothetical protein KC351_g6438 [Hortaea werneckii]|nr:hypothetical protein KC351_g6438 [Hortaea werneckii]